jgi:hypothetical protein
MDLSVLYAKALRFDFLTVEEAVELFNHAPLAELMFVADELRQKQVGHGKVTWQMLILPTSILTYGKLKKPLNGAGISYYYREVIIPNWA